MENNFMKQLIPAITDTTVLVEEHLRPRVVMHKKSGQLYEKIINRSWGNLLAWEDLTHPDRKDKVISKDSPLMFSDAYKMEDFEELSML